VFADLRRLLEFPLRVTPRPCLSAALLSQHLTHDLWHKSWLCCPCASPRHILSPAYDSALTWRPVSGAMFSLRCAPLFSCHVQVSAYFNGRHLSFSCSPNQKLSLSPHVPSLKMSTTPTDPIFDLPLLCRCMAHLLFLPHMGKCPFFLLSPLLFLTLEKKTTHCRWTFFPSNPLPHRHRPHLGTTTTNGPG